MAALPALPAGSKGATLVKRAVEADTSHDLPLALSLYTEGIECLLYERNTTKNEAYKTRLQEKIDQYFSRAENIQNVIHPRPPPVVAAPKEKEKDKEPDLGLGLDPELAQLQAAISSVVLSKRPNVPWDSVAGLEEAKKLLIEAATLPIRYPELFTEERKPWNGILLYGPPGTGKAIWLKH